MSVNREHRLIADSRLVMTIDRVRDDVTGRTPLRRTVDKAAAEREMVRQVKRLRLDDMLGRAIERMAGP